MILSRDLRHAASAAALTAAALAAPLWLKLAVPVAGADRVLREIPVARIPLPPPAHDPEPAPQPAAPDPAQAREIPEAPILPPALTHRLDPLAPPQIPLLPPALVPLEVSVLPAEVGPVPTARAVLELGEVDGAPTPLVQGEPVYPFAASLRRLAGSVVVEFVVTAGGGTESIRVSEASPPGWFEDAAVQAVKGWRFQPATRDGRPVAVRVRQRIRFEMP